MDLTPGDLRVGADKFARNAEVLLGHAKSVGDLAALRAAFAGSGEAAWQLVEARLTELAGRLDNAHGQTADAGTLLRTAADGFTGIDQTSQQRRR